MASGDLTISHTRVGPFQAGSMDFPMSDDSLPTSRQARAVDGRSRRSAVTGKLKVAIEGMIWRGPKSDEVTAQAGFTDSSLPFALQSLTSRPVSMARWLRACNVQRLDVIVDDSGNMGCVATIETLDMVANSRAAPCRPRCQVSRSSSFGRRRWPASPIGLHSIGQPETRFRSDQQRL
jgi:hypothetical protein